MKSAAFVSEVVCASWKFDTKEETLAFGKLVDTHLVDQGFFISQTFDFSFTVWTSRDIVTRIVAIVEK